MADLGSVVRLDSNNIDSFSFGFVLDEELHLVKAPIANPIVHSPSSVLLSYPFEVFHHNLVSIEAGNNLLAYVMVNPSHVTSFSSRQLLEKPLAGTSAFSLENRTQIPELPLDLLDFGRIVKPVVRSDSQIVYSEINAKNSSLRATVHLRGINLFRECKDKETSAFFIQSQKAFSNIPTEIFFVASRNVKPELLPTIEQSKNENVSFEVSTSWEVISYRSSLDN